MAISTILKQRKWADEELSAAGFRYYPARKQLVMARVLPEEEAPATIPSAYGPLVAQAGHIICYLPGHQPVSNLEAYHHWPVVPETFQKQYAPWDKPGWQPNPAEQHLMQNGCNPYYKTAGVWAKCLQESMLVQSLESLEPMEAPPGAWLCIGMAGEPYIVTEAEFRRRYVTPRCACLRRVIARITGR